MKTVSIGILAILGLISTLTLSAIFILSILVAFNDANTYTETKSFVNAVFWLLLIGVPLTLFVIYFATIWYTKSSVLPAGKSVIMPILIYFVASVILPLMMIVVGTIMAQAKVDPIAKKVTEQKQEKYSDANKLEKIKLVRDELKKHSASSNKNPKICVSGNRFLVIDEEKECNSVAKSSWIETGDFELVINEKAPSYNTSSTKEIYIKPDYQNGKLIYFQNDGKEMQLSY